MRQVIIISVAAVLAAACQNSGSSTSSAPPPKAAPCPTSYKELKDFDKPGDKVCSCADAGKGQVWGSDIYTTDSAICQAAVHAGVITAKGGDVKMKYKAGCGSYTGTNRNGVTTAAWGSFPGSFFFGDKEPVCPTAATGTGTQVTITIGSSSSAPATPPAASAATSGSGFGSAQNKCPAAFNAIPNLKADTEINCSCDAAAVTGSLWGSGTYTQDSSICRAAVHAGVIPATGGNVNAKAAPGCQSYASTDANGQKSDSWGSFNGSFYFPSKGAPVCANPAPPVAPAASQIGSKLGPAPTAPAASSAAAPGGKLGSAPAPAPAKPGGKLGKK